jgi:hypothetical protein
MKNQTKFFILLGLFLLIVVFAVQWMTSNKQVELQVPPSKSQAVVTIAESGVPIKARTNPTGTQNTGQNTNTAKDAPTSPVEKTIRASINFSNGKKYEGLVFAQNAFEALQEIAKVQNFTVVTKDYKYGKMVEKIADTASDAQNFWSYSVNGKMGNVSGSMYVLHPNDTVEWVYTKINK